MPAARFLFVLISLTLTSNLSFSAPTKRCYKFRLLGGIIDVNQCESTAIQAIEFKCGTKQRLQLKRLQGTLKKCSPNSASGIVKIDGRAIPFVARRSSKLGVEYWSIAQVSKSRTKKAPRLSAPKSPKGTKATPPTEILAQPSLDEFPLKISAYTDFYYAYNVNNPRPSSTTPGITLAPAEQNKLRLSDAYHNQLNIGIFNVGFRYPFVGSEILLDVAGGRNSELWTKSLNGTVLGHSSYMRRVEIKYELTPNGKSILRVGKFKSPFMYESQLSGKNWFFSHGLLQGVAAPHFHTGLLWDRHWFDWLQSKLYLVNGWNIVQDNNRSFSLGLQGDAKFSNSIHGILDFYWGPEGDQDEGAIRTVVQYSMTNLYGNKFPSRTTVMYGHSRKEGMLTGSSKDADWYGISTEARYPYKDDIDIAARLEWLLDEKAVNTRLYPVTNVTSLTLSATKSWNPKLSSKVELRGDLGDKKEFPMGIGAEQSQVTILGSVSAEL